MKTIRTILSVVLSATLGGGCAERNAPTAPRVPSADAAVAAPNAGSLVELSRPNAVGTCNTGFNAFGTWPTDEAEEPYVAVNPVHPNNIVAAWIQGPFQNIIAAASFDGGQTWQQVPLPLTVCSGGPFLATADVWLSFAPDGVLYGIALTQGNSSSSRVAEVIKSMDGGLHWTASVLPGSNNVDSPPDHPSLTADPTDAAFVYAIWDGHSSPHSTAAVFARTTDGGSTWEPLRAIFQTAEQSYIQFSQILVLPNGTLVDLYEFYAQQPNGPITQTSLQLLRSADHGQTWSTAVNAVTMTPLYTPEGNTLVVDPETKQPVRDPTNPSFAVDMRNGNLYAVWEDGRFANFQYNDIAFSMSADGGASWSAPIRVNRPPTGSHSCLRSPLPGTELSASPTTTSDSTAPTLACRPIIGWSSVIPRQPALLLNRSAGAARFASRTARSIWRPSSPCSSAGSFRGSTLGWPPPGMISWPPLLSRTRTTSPASSSLGASAGDKRCACIAGGEITMYRLRMESCLLLPAASLTACSDHNTPTARLAGPLAATATLTDRPYTWTLTWGNIQR